MKKNNLFYFLASLLCKQQIPTKSHLKKLLSFPTDPQYKNNTNS